MAVKPATPAPFHLGNDRVDLMNNNRLWAMRPFGGPVQRPARVAPGDPFSARFSGDRD
jgi:hypothetical protein